MASMDCKPGSYKWTIFLGLLIYMTHFWGQASASRTVESDRAALHSLYTAWENTDPGLREALPGWGNSSDPCSPIFRWDGVTCSEQLVYDKLSQVYNKNWTVIGLDLHNKRIVGILPPAIGDFKYLQALDLSGNKLNGRIPRSLGYLRYLQHLDLSNNSLSGLIPVSLPRRGLLVGLNNLTELKTMVLSRNELNGSLPRRLQDLHRLERLDLNGNKLSGMIPARSLAYLRCLRQLDLSNNSLSGWISPVSMPSQRRILADLTHLSPESWNKLNISLESEFPRDMNVSTLTVGPLSVGAILGIVGGLNVLGFIFAIYWMQSRSKSDKQLQLRLIKDEFLRQQVQPRLFPYNELRIATRDFHPNNKLGEGGFGAVHKGVLKDGTEVAVKQLSCGTAVKQLSTGEPQAEGITTFLNEVILITKIQHRNLVKLIGCCFQGSQRLLVYEYVENNNLGMALFGRGKDDVLLLDWPRRLSISIGIARGLVYLHEESQPRIIHRDIKSSNILLDKNLNPKIADFGLARLFPDEMNHISATHVSGTFGYLAPEYAVNRKLTEKVDVYSFGIVLLELVSGRKTISLHLDAEEMFLLDWVWELYEKEKVMDVLDPKLKGIPQTSEIQVLRMITIALLCTQASASRRPSMSRVLSMLLGEDSIDSSDSVVTTPRDAEFRSVKSPCTPPKQDSSINPTHKLNTGSLNEHEWRMLENSLASDPWYIQSQGHWVNWSPLRHVPR